MARRHRDNQSPDVALDALLQTPGHRVDVPVVLVVFPWRDGLDHTSDKDGEIDVCPQLRQTLFKANRPGYFDLAVDKSAIKSTIYQHPEFVTFIARMNALFAEWRQKSAATLRQLQPGCHPKNVIADLSEDLLAHYTSKPLLDKYDIYQHLLDYWAETMQDDCYLIAADDWKAETYRIIEKDKKGKENDKGWACDLVPKNLIVAHYFPWGATGN